MLFRSLSLSDRFGKYPEKVLWLYYLSRLRIIANEKGITSIKIETTSILMEKDKQTISLAIKISKPQDLEKIPYLETFAKPAKFGKIGDFAKFYF